MRLSLLPGPALIAVPARNRAPETVMGDRGASHGKRGTGQPMQGFSGYSMNKADAGGTYLRTDNGSGTKANSPVALLMFHQMLPTFETGAMEILESAFLRDPDMKVPFRIACLPPRSWHAS